jgi:hypothetical protein
VEQRRKWSNEGSGATKEVEQRTKWSNERSGAANEVEQRTKWSHEGSGAANEVGATNLEGVDHPEEHNGYILDVEQGHHIGDSMDQL